MKNVNPIVAGVVDGEVNKNIHLELIVEDDAFEDDGFIFCLAQIDRESIPGSSIVLDEKDIYIRMNELKQFCLHGLRMCREMKKMMILRQLDQDSEISDLLGALEEECDE